VHYETVPSRPGEDAGAAPLPSWGRKANIIAERTCSLLSIQTVALRERAAFFPQSLALELPVVICRPGDNSTMIGAISRGYLCLTNLHERLDNHRICFVGNSCSSFTLSRRNSSSLAKRHLCDNKSQVSASVLLMVLEWIERTKLATKELECRHCQTRMPVIVICLSLD
jgi:hypothetical protein